jgi:hypothetical protein
MKGVTVSLTANGRTIQLQISLDVGMDVGSYVEFTCKLPFAFTGKIKS